MAILSVVIPTHRRPQYLARAVRSALEAAPVGDTEIIVVPNGDDLSWKSIEIEFATDSRVRWHSVAQGHANVARNHGLRQATSDYVRFLDDDDYLYPEACQRQLQALIQSGGDVSSGDVDLVSSNRRSRRTLVQPDTSDFASSALMPSRMTHLAGHVYRRESLAGMRWEEGRMVRQDTAWLIQLSMMKEIEWQRHPEAVGVWFQHAGERISRGRDPGPTALRETAELIMRAHDHMASEGRLTTERLQAAADGLWSSLQKGLQYDFTYWYDVSRIADSYSPGRRPPSAIHRFPIVRRLPPLAVETVLIPVRVMYRFIRRFLDKHGIQRV